MDAGYESSTPNTPAATRKPPGQTIPAAVDGIYK